MKRQIMDKKNIARCGFAGGSRMYSLGSLSDMIFFFKCINYDVARAYPKEDFSVITDRLYRRYLRFEELDEAVEKMKFIEEMFKTVDSKLYEWTEAEKEGAKTFLNFRQDTMFDIFKEYFDGFYECVSSAKYFFKAGEKYSPVKVSPADATWYFAYRDSHSLEEFDALGSGEEPFWQRKGFGIKRSGICHDVYFCSNVIKYKNTFIKKVAKKILERPDRLPPESILKVVIDTKGMQITKEQQDMIKNLIIEKTNDKVEFDNITIKMSED
jgi:hypothetical protein